MIRFLYLNTFIFIHTVIMSLWGIIISPLNRNGSLVHRYCAVPWAKAILKVCGVKLKVDGLENIKRAGPYIYMSNHQSYFDIFALLGGLPVDFKFLLKQELMKIPLMGITMRRAGYISIDRGDARKAIKSVNSAAEKVRAGSSVLIFPEGTRSEDGRIGTFKKGGFHIALKSGCDIVPVAIVNCQRIVQKGNPRINRGTIDMNIGRPIPVKDYSKKDINKLIERTRESVIRSMAEKGRCKA